MSDAEAEPAGELPEWWKDMVVELTINDTPYDRLDVWEGQWSKIETAIREHAERGRLLQAFMDALDADGIEVIAAIGEAMRAARKHLRGG